MSLYWGILHRMIFWELARVFFLALVALTGMLVMGGVVAEATQRGLGPMQLLMAIPLLVPSTLPYTLPATTLFATCVVYGRLAHDNEILALKASGIHLWHVVWPAVFLGLATSAITFALSLDIIPTTHHTLRTMFINNVEDFLYNTLRREGCIRHSKIDYTIYVQRVQGRKLLEALFMHRDPKTQRLDPKEQTYDVVAWAREAELHVDLAKNQLLVKMNNCYVSGASDDVNGQLSDNKDWPMELQPDITETRKKSSARAMTWLEIYDEIDKTHDLLLIDQDFIAKHQAVMNAGHAPLNYPEDVKNTMNQAKQKESQIRHLDTELHMRPALALGCLCFVLVGCPVGIWFSRSDYLSAFITCFLPIVLIYYPLLLCGINLAKLGRLNPWLALWTANGLMGIIALGLFRRLLKN